MELIVFDDVSSREGYYYYYYYYYYCHWRGEL